MLDFLLHSSPFTLAILIFILALSAFFGWSFLRPSVVLARRLTIVINRLREINNPTKKLLEPVFGLDTALRHLWTKYAETLHLEQEQGGGKPVKLRSTVPASSIFTVETVVDARISTEFFKHLPGIFTGLGILGTFSGLILGLQNFNPSGESNAVRDSLSMLLGNVGHAFIVSAIAIGLAMIVTFTERVAVATLYRQVDEMAVQLDGFFASGVGEDYLGRLTRASEDSAAQAKILKDALVGDLERILTTLTERQVQAQVDGTRKLGEELTRGVTTALAEPLRKLTETANTNTANNGEAVTKLLTDVLAAFGQKLEDLFGGQIGGINEMQQRTIDSLGSAVSKLNELVSSVEQAGAKSADAMNQRLLAAIGDMEAHQKAANEQMAAFVDRMREAVDQSQAETGRKMQETLSRIGVAVEAQLAALKEQGERTGEAQSRREGEAASRVDEMLRALGGQISQVLDTMRAKAEEGAEAGAARENAHAQRSAELLEGLGGRVDELLRTLGAQTDRTAEKTSAVIAELSSVTERMVTETRAAVAGMSTAVDSMRAITSTSVDRMTSGAETMRAAAAEFATAGQSVSGVFQQADALSHGLRQSATAIETASTSLSGVVADHAASRDVLASMLKEMGAIVENAKREAGLAADALTRIEAAAQGLGQAQRQAEEYLAEVTKILGATHEKYAASLASTMGDQYKLFFGHLSEAIGLLQGAIQELAISVQPAGVKRAAE